jgi:Ca2+-binding EF-hand superfamily protein
MRRLGVAAGVLMLAVAVPAVAQQVQEQAAGPQQPARARQAGPMFDRLDKDKDGAISIGEWPRQAQAFNRLDVNKDNLLSREELQRAPTPRQFVRQQRNNRQIQRQARRLDTNRDRTISREEWRVKAELFDRMDADKDGKLTLQEMRRFRARRGGRVR